MKIIIFADLKKSKIYSFFIFLFMYWTLELISHLDDAPFPATKQELIDYAQRTGLPFSVIENLEALDDDNTIYENSEEVWPEYPTKEDFFFNEDEY